MSIVEMERERVQIAMQEMRLQMDSKQHGGLGQREDVPVMQVQEMERAAEDDRLLQVRFCIHTSDHREGMSQMLSEIRKGRDQGP